MELFKQPNAKADHPLFSCPKRRVKSLGEEERRWELNRLGEDRDMSLVEGEVDLVTVFKDFNKTVGPIPSRDAADLVDTFSVFDPDDDRLGFFCTKCLLQRSDRHHILVRACVGRER